MAKPAAHLLLSDMALEVVNLRRADTLALVTGAAVQAVVLDKDTQIAVAGVPNPLALAEVDAVNSPGLYRGTIPDTASLTDGQDLEIVITADAGAGLLRTFYLDATVEKG